MRRAFFAVMKAVEDPTEWSIRPTEGRQINELRAIEGTAPLAQIPGFRVAGKTGTAYKAEGGGYSLDRYVGTFGGVAPVSNPRLAAVVVIDEPTAGKHHGGEVAAPVFASVMSGALRLMDVPPDDLQNVPAATLVQANDAP